jgi:hypothetical protein
MRNKKSLRERQPLCAASLHGRRFSRRRLDIRRIPTRARCTIGRETNWSNLVASTRCVSCRMRGTSKFSLQFSCPVRWLFWNRSGNSKHPNRLRSRVCPWCNSSVQVPSRDESGVAVRLFEAGFIDRGCLPRCSRIGMRYAYPSYRIVQEHRRERQISSRMRRLTLPVLSWLHSRMGFTCPVLFPRSSDAFVLPVTLLRGNDVFSTKQLNRTPGNRCGGSLLFAKTPVIAYLFFPNTVSVAQLAEHQIVALRVAGSSPVAHPKRKKQNLICPYIMEIRARR